jgi:hypothetical protein
MHVYTRARQTPVFMLVSNSYEGGKSSSPVYSPETSINKLFKRSRAAGFRALRHMLIVSCWAKFRIIAPKALYWMQIVSDKRASCVMRGRLFQHIVCLVSSESQSGVTRFGC